MGKEKYIPESLKFYFRWKDTYLHYSLSNNFRLWDKILSSSIHLYYRYYGKNPSPIKNHLPLWPELDLLFSPGESWAFLAGESFFYDEIAIRTKKRQPGQKINRQIFLFGSDEKIKKRKKEPVRLLPVSQESTQSESKLLNPQAVRIFETGVDPEELNFRKSRRRIIEGHFRKIDTNYHIYPEGFHEKRQYISFLLHKPSPGIDEEKVIFRKSGSPLPSSFFYFDHHMKINDFSSQGRSYLPIAFTHKPSFTISAGNTNGIIRDPANPHRYKIKESLIPSISQIQKAMSANSEEQIAYKMFKPVNSNTAEHIHYGIISRNPSDPLVNLIRFNYFTEEFIKDIVTAFKTIAEPAGKADSVERINQSAQDDTANKGREGLQEKSSSSNSFWKNRFKFFMSRPKTPKTPFQPVARSFSPFHPKSLQTIVSNYWWFFPNKSNPEHGIDGHNVAHPNSSGEFIGKRESLDTDDGYSWNFKDEVLGINGWNVADETVDEIYHEEGKNFKQKQLPIFLDKIVNFFTPVRSVKMEKNAAGEHILKVVPEEIPIRPNYQKKVVPVVENGSKGMDELQVFRKQYHPVLETWQSMEEWYAAFGGKMQNIGRFNKEFFSDAHQQFLLQRIGKESTDADLENHMQPAFIQDSSAAKDETDPEIFFRKHVPEAFSSHAEFAQSPFKAMQSVYDMTEKKELDPSERKKLLLELTDRVWEHVKRKLKQR